MPKNVSPTPTSLSPTEAESLIQMRTCDSADVTNSAEPTILPILELQTLTKQYPGVIANDRVDMTLFPGEIHAILGENGAGKSTLMKMIYGVEQPTSGTIIWEGKPQKILNPAMARRLGIGMVFQHFALFETLSVVENVALALDAKDFDLAALSQKIRDVSAHYGLPVEPRRQVYSLSVGERQRVEIVRCLLQNPKLLIMDEPTSVLTPQAVQTLFKTLRQLSDEGCAILYISHKLDEIQSLCHQATVLRHGKVTGHADPSKESAITLAEMMIGSALPEVSRESQDSAPHSANCLTVKQLSLSAATPFETALTDIGLTVAAGEIVGIAGVSGNGQAELIRAISGEYSGHEIADDAVVIMGKPVGKSDTAARRELGMVFVPEERLGRGAVPILDLRQNAVLTAHRQGLVRKGLFSWLRPKTITQFTQDCIAQNDVRTGSEHSVAKSLSGGNLQKFIVGRELAQSPKLVVISQPTWGVDVGAASYIRQELLDMANNGVGILVVSEELDELFEICDRLHVIADGHLSPAKAIGETDVKEVGLWMAGLWPGGPGQIAETSGNSENGVNEVAV